MKFNLLLGMEEDEIGVRKVFQREAVRGLVRKNGEILMIHTKEGDYKFPGGGVEETENHEEALKREVLEETGLEIDEVYELIGQVIERREDQHDSSSVFEMVSYYYLCSGEKELTKQNLIGYEIELDYKPYWLIPEEAFLNNLSIYRDDFPNRWLQRETEVLRFLLEESTEENDENDENMRAGSSEYEKTDQWNNLLE